MGNIIALSGGQHLETQSLLPWYVSKRLEASECARVEAHLVECSECRADLSAERRLSSEWATMPIETEASWLSLRERLSRHDGDRASRTPVSTKVGGALLSVMRAQWWFGGLGWALAVGQAVALVVIAISFRATVPTPLYRALGDPTAPSIGNALVIFNPNASERQFRYDLEACHARVVDGPTASGVYILRIPENEREATLIRLRSMPEVELAQPIDPGVTR